MDKLIIKGNAKISGSVNVHGSKNAALPIIVSSLLSEKIVKLSNVPNVVDVLNLIKLLKNYGVKIEYKKDKRGYPICMSSVYTKRKMKPPKNASTNCKKVFNK